MNFEIFYPTPLAEIEDPTNANIDVCVRTNEGKDYTLVFITPDNLKSLMESNNESYQFFCAVFSAENNTIEEDDRAITHTDSPILNGAEVFAYLFIEKNNI